MDFTNPKHDGAIATIEGWITNNKTWDEINTLSLISPSHTFEQNMELLGNITSLDCKYKKDEWEELVSHIKDLEEPTINAVNKLAEGTKNDAKISQSSRSAWQLYRSKLLERNWSRKSIDGIEESAFEILQMLSQDTKEIEAVKGLVLGNVQSGKTANMAGLISMAADYGFNYFIVLSGVIDSLREQTERRLYDDLHADGNIKFKIIKNPHPHKWHIQGDQMDKLNLKSDGISRDAYLSVVLKNSVRLDNLKKYIYSNESKMKQLKILVIDDEADQASINTKKMDNLRSSEDEVERTTINNHITELVNGYNGNKLKAVNYISYTATPYANILNESTKASLYPKDFVISLTPSEDYLGPKQIFGLSEPEQNSRLDIVREISPKDTELLGEIHKGESMQVPSSFKRAINWFLISSVAMKHRNHKKPISMLIHTSHLVDDHEIIEEMAKDYLYHIRNVNPNDFLKQCEKLYLTETTDFTKDDFLSGVPNYSIPKEDVLDYPEWDVIEKGLRALLARDDSEYLTRIKMDEDGQKKYARGIHLCIDNSRSFAASDEHLRLVYPDKSNDPGFATMFIVIGGNTLSRGLTLEGLVTSYFMRNTIASDSLMQMGRWFGYRIGYELYPRIWLNELVKERFRFVTQLDEELRDDIKEFERLGKTPKDFGIRVKNSPNNSFIQVTSKNKMQGAVASTLSFEGIQKQTILFEDDYDALSNNVHITKSFLNNLGEPRVNGSRVVWKNVNFDVIKEEFFSKYRASDRDIMFSNLSAFIEWCDKADDEDLLRNWSVVLSSKGDINENNSTKNTWDIHGYNVTKVTRSVLDKRQSDDKTISIGALRSPKDLLSDITDLNKEESTGTKNMQEVRIIRENHGVENVPQLVIYVIDKDSKPPSNSENNKRSPLNFSQDIVGISLMIPGIKKGNNVATSLKVKIYSNDDDTSIEMEED